MIRREAIPRSCKRSLIGGLVGKGATLQRFHDTRESGLELIQKLMLNTRKPLHIRDQIVRQHMTLLESDAGKFLGEGLAARQKGFRQELESLGKQSPEAIKAKDVEINQILIEEKARAQKKLEKAEAERILLEGLHAAEIERVDPSRAPAMAYMRRSRAATTHFS